MERDRRSIIGGVEELRKRRAAEELSQKEAAGNLVPFKTRIDNLLLKHITQETIKSTDLHMPYFDVTRLIQMKNATRHL